MAKPAPTMAPPTAEAIIKPAGTATESDANRPAARSTHRPTAATTIAVNITLKTDQSDNLNWAVSLRGLPKPAFSST